MCLVLLLSATVTSQRKVKICEYWQEQQEEIETVMKLENVSVSENLLNALRKMTDFTDKDECRQKDSGVFTDSNQTRKHLQKQ